MDILKKTRASEKMPEQKKEFFPKEGMLETTVAENKTEEFEEEDNQLPPAEQVHEIHNVLFRWSGTEHERYDVRPLTYLIAALVLSIIVVYALISDNPIMAITFILIGVAGYLYLNQEPRVVDFYVTSEGVIIDKELYEFDQIKSFWIFYEPPHSKILSLRMKKTLLPYIRIPVHDQDPVKIRQILLQFLPEKKQEYSLSDTLEKIIHM